MKKSTLTLLLLATVLLANAQPFKFTRPYGAVETDINRGYRIIPTQDGNYVVAGEWNGQGYLMKLNCKGDSIDRKTYTAVVGGNSVITDVLELPNGDLLVGGQCDHCVPGDTTGKVIVFQTDANLNYKPSPGVKKFLPPVTGPLMTTGEAFPDTKLAAASDGFYVLSITHCLSDPAPFGCWNSEDSYITKMDNSLNIQWQKLLDYKNGFIFHYENNPQIRATPNNLYVSRWGNNLFSTVPDSSAVQKTDLNGNPLVSKTFRGRIFNISLNPAGTVLTCAGDTGSVAWLAHLDANNLNVLNDTTLTQPTGLSFFDVQYSSDGHLLAGSRHVEPSALRSRIYRMESDFEILNIDTIPNPDNITNMGVTDIWPTNADGSRLVSCGIRGFYNRTFFHAVSDCEPFNLALANVNHVTCNGFSNGSVTLALSNGYGPFQYRRGTGNWQNNNTFNNLAAGTYTFFARDGNGNVLSLEVTIAQPPALTIAASVNLNVITVTAGGGTPPYEYRLGISGAYQTSPVFDSLANSAYIVTVRDANGCSTSTTALVNVPALQISSAATGQILCFGEMTGEITVTATAGVSPYWYSLNDSPLQSGNVFSGLAADSYDIKVTDSQGNTKTNTVTITQPPALAVSLVVNQSTITANAAGGTPPLQYSLDGQNYQPSNVFNDLNDDAYTVTVKDANGCTMEQSATVATPPTAAFSASPTSGCGPLTVQFTNSSSANATSFSWQFPGGTPATSTAQNPTVTYVEAGTYSVTLTASNATGSNTASQTNLITVLPDPEAEFDYTSDGTTYTFTNTSENATAYLWHFGDGNASTETDPEHNFAGSPCAERNVTLVAFNTCGTDTATLFIPHTDPVSPTAEFSYSGLDLTVAFTSSSQFAETHLWDFGDSNMSNEKDPVHIYASPGEYLVTLIVKEICGILSDSAEQTVILTVAAGELSWLTHFRLFPNPNAGVFTLEINGEPQSELAVSMFNQVGQLVDRQILDFKTGRLQERFDFGDLPPGIYTLQVLAQGEAKYVKVAVTK
jgi:PKD repeat protein